VSEAEPVGYPKSPATVEADAGGAQDKPSGARRMIHILGALLVAVVLPALLMGAFVGRLGVSALFIGLTLGVVGSKIGGIHRMLFVAPMLGVAAGLGAFTAYDWWWAALLASVGVIAGAGIGFGWFAPLLMVPYAATFVTPVSSGTDAVIYGVIVAIATLYGIVIARRFGAPAVVEGYRLSPPAAASVAIVFGAVLGASAALGVALGWTEPYWVPEPILVLVLYLLIGKRDRIRGKAIGTALGVAAAIPVAILDPPAGVLAAVGTIAFVLALTQAKKYWLMYGLYTFSLVLLLASPGQVGFEAEERGFQILVGIGLLVIGLGIVHALSTRLSKRDPQPELAPAA
jgi:Fusaric acid resistance protein-like